MILDPPPQYDHPYAGPMIEWVLKAPEVDKLCRQAGAHASGQIIGCQFMFGETCVIVLSAHAVAVLRRHETAHCVGWKHQ